MNNKNFQQENYYFPMNGSFNLFLVLTFSALFAAVEHGHLDKARTILESTDVDVNRWVSEYFSGFW